LSHSIVHDSPTPHTPKRDNHALRYAEVCYRGRNQQRSAKAKVKEMDLYDMNVWRPKVCPNCGDRGIISKRKQAGRGLYIILISNCTAPECGWSGEIAENHSQEWANWVRKREEE